MTDRPPMRRPSADVRHELQQSKPFRSEFQEANIALLRTASVVSRQFARVVEPHGISTAQYNVLRILRGAVPDGLPTLAIRDRMIEEGSTVTRLLDKLEASGLVERSRTRPDRRQVLCLISPAGLELLERLDPIVDAANVESMSMLPPDTLRQFIDILGQIRMGHPPDGCAAELDGQ